MDRYSYHCGVIDAFNVLISSGVREMAFSHPCITRWQRDALIPFAETICSHYGTRFYPEDDLLITDLFPLSVCRNQFLLIFYRNPDTLSAYEHLKERKRQLLERGRYQGENRRELALQLGKLLGYPETTIQQMIDRNQDKEELPCTTSNRPR